MNLAVQRAIDRYVGVPCCALLSAVSRFLPGRRQQPPKRILVILLSEMGSLVLALPMLDRLRERYPGAKLYALAFARNREVLALLKRVPDANIITVRDTSLGTLAIDALRAIRRLRRARIDTVIDGELFSRVSSVFSFLSGAGARVGFHRHKQEGLYRGSFINRPVLYNPYNHISEQFVTLVEAIDASGHPLVKRVVPAPVDTLPEIALDRTVRESFRARLHRDFPGIDPDRLVLVYAAGGLLPIRAWPREHYRRLCTALAEQGYTVAAIGMPSDFQLGAYILSDCPEGSAWNLAGFTKSVEELLALLHTARLLITNDGGPGHFASCTPIHVIMLFGPETPDLYRPLSPRVSVFYTPLSCSPCLTAANHRNSPCDGNNRCLRLISVESVRDCALDTLRART